MKQFFKDGTTVLFQGDSVTDAYRKRENDERLFLKPMGEGYPAKFEQLYRFLFPSNEVKFVNRGVSGDRIINLLERYEEDFKKVNPDFISILIGVNDTWRGFDINDPESAELFEERYEKLLKQIKTDLPNAKILILSQFTLPHFSPCGHSYDEVLADFMPKLKVTEKLAAKYADYYIPFHEIINNEASNVGAVNLSEDGVHPTSLGHAFMATEIAKKLEIL